MNNSIIDMSGEDLKLKDGTQRNIEDVAKIACALKSLLACTILPVLGKTALRI